VREKAPRVWWLPTSDEADALARSTPPAGCKRTDRPPPVVLWRGSRRERAVRRSAAACSTSVGVKLQQMGGSASEAPAARVDVGGVMSAEHGFDFTGLPGAVLAIEPDAVVVVMSRDGGKKGDG
jgi:hypothetical protein